MDNKEKIASMLSEATGIEVEKVLKLVEIPPKKEMGDFAFPTFTLAKEFKKAPNIIAQEIKEKLDPTSFERIENMGPYVNFFLDKGSFAKDLVSKILTEKENYGKSNTGNGRSVLIDYSSPNIAKPFNVALMYTTCLGNALHRIFSFEGYNAVGINHIGDYGTQFGKLIYAYTQWGDESALEEDPIKELTRIYVKFHQEAEKDPSLDDKGRAHFKNLEDGKEFEVKLWERFRELSLKDFKKVYDMLDIKFDSVKGEAFYQDMMPKVIDEIKNSGILTESQGANVVMLDEYKMPPAIVLKSDGSSIYITRDIAAAEYRKKTYDFYKALYVVANDQALHFKQLFKVLELMGHEWAKDMVHVGFGLIKFKGMKFSTRQGNIMYLEDFLNDAIKIVTDIINEKNPDLADKEEVAKKVAIGGVKFIYLKNNREKEINFDFEEVLNFDGETGPYVQYTYARGKSILRKNDAENANFENADLSLLKEVEEFELIKTLSQFNQSVLDAIEKYEPSIVTRYTLDVAKSFNKFYNNIQISTSQDDVKLARLALVEASCQVIKNGLNLIGVQVVERM